MNKNYKQKVSYIFINPNDSNLFEKHLYETILCRLAEKGVRPFAAKRIH